MTDFTLNGKPVSTTPATGERLSETLRESLGARDVKIGCNAGDCGACTVLLDGTPVCACLTPTQQAEGRQVHTLTGLQDDEIAARLRDSFQDYGAAQCGICTPGMMVAAVALLRENPDPTTEQVQDALGGVLCRCTGYRKIIEAVLAVANPAPALDDHIGHTGAAIRRLDGQAKVEGREAFGDDIAPPGTLEILIIRSPHARAAFTLGDLDGFIASHDGVETVLTAADIPGQNCFGVIPDFADQPVFAVNETRFPWRSRRRHHCHPRFHPPIRPRRFSGDMGATD